MGCFAPGLKSKHSRATMIMWPRTTIRKGTSNSIQYSRFVAVYIDFSSTSLPNRIFSNIKDVTMECEQSQQLLISDIKGYEPQDPKDGTKSWSQRHAKEVYWKLLIASFFALALSILCNVILFLSIAKGSERHILGKESPSAYGMPPLTKEPHSSRLRSAAGLTKTKAIAQVQDTDWWGLNETRADELWGSIRTEQGMVALSNDFTDSRGLPRGVAFPWDETKSVYFLQAYHTLHCLVIL